MFKFRLKKKRFLWAGTALIIGLVALECFLRFHLGFCSAVLMQESTDYEYIAQPNQNTLRFTNRVKYNNFSMRADSLKKGAIKILGFGDSVINGGTLTDQDSLATTILSIKLSKALDTSVQVLNISAGSWGPDNCVAYLKKHGTFGAKLIFLVVSSHDAYDNMEFENIVGINPNFPDKQYRFAIVELFHRYLFQFMHKESEEERLGINKKKSNCFNKGFNEMCKISKELGIPFIIYLHPERIESCNQKYNEQGQEIIDFCLEKGIPLIKGIDFFKRIIYYRDGIHLNERGQKKLAEVLYIPIIDQLNSN